MRGARALLLGLALLLPACSATRFAYNHLDTVVRWKLDDYVALSRSQQQAFDTRFDSLWRWHRVQELPAYAADLRAWAALPMPLSATEVESIFDAIDAHARRLMARGNAEFLPLLATLEDTQVASMVARLRKDLAEEIDEYRERDPDDAITKRCERIEEWTGRLHPPQREDCRRYVATQIDTSPLWFAVNRQWIEDFEALLAQRQTDDFTARATALFETGRARWPADLAAAVDANRAASIEYLAALSGTLDQAQQAHARERLLDYAEDFAELSRRAP